MNKIRSLKRLFGRKGVSRRRSLRFGRALPIRFAEYAELLEDRTLLTASLLDAPLEGIINQGSQNELQLTLPAASGGSGTVSLGFLMSADQSSLNPAAIRFKNAAGTVIAPSFSNPNRAGGSQSLAVVNLGPGEFTVIVGGDNNTSGAFTMDLFLPGDMNQNGDVSQNELLHTEAALVQRLFGGNHIIAQFFKSQGINFSTNLFHVNMDANLNGMIDQFDVDQALINATSPSVNFRTIELIGDNDAPAITARVTTDTGPSNTDNVTNNLNVEITISDESNITSFSASLDGATLVNFSGFLIPGNLDPNGSTFRFSFTQNSLASTFGVPPASLVNMHTISFLAEDELLNNNNANPFEFTFTLDQTSPSLDNQISNQLTNEDVDLSEIVDLAGVFSDDLLLTFSAISNDPSLVVALINGPLLSLDVQDDQNGMTTITVTATDLAGNFTQVAFDITVTPVNDEPSFQIPASDTVLEDSGARTVANFASSFDAGAPNEAGQTFTFNIFIDAENTIPGLFAVAPAIDPNGQLTYTPAGNANGFTTISVEMVDNGGTANGGDDTSQILNFDINVTSINDEPSFTVPPSDTVLEDSGARTVPDFASNFDAGAPNETGQTFTFIIDNPNPGLFAVAPAIASNGQLTYTPADDANGSTTISVQMVDDGGTANGGDDTSQTLTFEINVTPVNDEPSFQVPVFDTVLEDSGARTVPDFASNFDAGAPNETGQTFTFNIDNPNPGLFAVAPAIDPNGQLTYTPADDANGSTTISVQMVDDGGTANGGDDTSGTLTFDIIVTPVNDEPTFTKGDDENENEDSGTDGAHTVGGWATNISKGPDNEFGQTLTFNVTNNNNDLFSVQPDVDEATGDLTYTLALHAFGSAEVRVTLMDDGETANGGDDSSTQMFNIIITEINDAPTGVNDGPIAVLNDPNVTTTIDVLDNDTDADLNNAAPETDMLTIVGIDSSTTMTPGGDEITGGVGTIIINNNMIEYTPPDTQERDVTIIYRLQDNNPGDASIESTATLTINVRANQPPTPQDDNPDTGFDQSTDEDTVATIDDDTLLDNDTDPENDTLSITAVVAMSAQGAVVSINGSGDIEYDPRDVPILQALAAGSNTTDTFDYTVGDGQGNFAMATVTITVTGVNDDPTPQNDPNAGSTNEDSPVNIAAATLLANDTDPDDGETATLTVVSVAKIDGTTLGEVSFDSNTITYDPNGQFESLNQVQSTTDTFEYTVRDAQGAMVTATATVTINGVNDAPSFSITAADTTLEDSGAQSVENFATDLSTGPGNESGQTLSFNITDNTNTTLFSAGPAIDPNGQLTYTPAADANGSATISVELMDDGGTANGGENTSGTLTFDINVTPVNDEPSFSVPASDTVLEDSGARTVAGFASDFDAGAPNESGQTFTFNIVGNTNPELFAVAPTIDPNGQLTYTPAEDANGSATISVEVMDNGGADNGGDDTSGTRTFEINVTPVNDGPRFLGISNIVKTVVDPADQQISLDNAFSDPEGGQLTYSNPVSDNPLVTVSISNDNMLEISYTAYSATQDRSDPVTTIRVTATDPDDNTLSIEGMFDITLPQFTLDVQLVIRKTPTQPDEFTFFSAVAATTRGNFQLVSNGSNSLRYFLSGLNTNFDLDGTRTPGNSGDNVTALRFIDTSDSNADIFNILNDNIILDAATGEVDGSWDDDEADIDAFLSKLRNGQLAVQIVSNNRNEIVGDANINVTGQLATLPTSDTTFIVGNTYVVEVWMKDLLSENLANNDSEGLSSAFVDFTFAPNLASGEQPTSTNSPLDQLRGGGANTTNNAAGLVNNLGGGTLNRLIALEPAFALLGSVTFTADAVGNPNFVLAVDDMDGVNRRGGSGGGSGKVDASQYAITVPTIEHVGLSRFLIDMNNSMLTVTVTVGGVQVDPQQVGVSDRTNVSGNFEVFLDDLTNPTLIELIDANLELGIKGDFSPDPNNLGTARSTAPANLGYQDLNFPIQGSTGQLLVAIRDTEIEINDNGEQAAVDGSGNFTLDSTQFVIDTGDIDFQIFRTFSGAGDIVVASGQGSLDESLLVANTGDDAPGPGTIVNNDGTLQLTILFSHTVTQSIVINGQPTAFVANITGIVLATFTPPAPLLAKEPQETEAPVDGTAILMTLSRKRTTLNTSGGVEVLPESDPWVHEWDSFWVELWARTTDGPGIESGTVDLQYNTSYFTATEIDHGRVFRNETSGTIFDDEGLVDDIGGVAAEDGAGGDGYVLLGRVKFDSLDGDQVSVDIDNQFFGPFDLGLELSDAQVTVTGTDAVDVSLGESPETELWSVIYDLNDDDEINFADFAVFSSVFRQDVFTGDSPYVSMMDFNNDGNVDFGDMAAFAGNFRLTKANGESIQFPDSFAQRWAGADIVSAGSESVDDVVDAAIGAWQTALELANPFRIQVVVQDLGTDQLGDGQILAVGADGIPTHGRVVIDDDANGLGWYTGLGTPVPADQYDLYTVLLHEIGHALGFSQYYAGFAELVSTSEDGSTLFVGSDFTAVLTPDGLHLDDEAHPNDVMSETLMPAVRKEISSLDLSILQAAYDAALNGSSGFIDGASAALHADRQTDSELPVSTSQTPDVTTIDLTTNVSSETRFPKVVTGTASAEQSDASSGQRVSNQDHLGASSRFFKFPDDLQYDEPEHHSVPLTTEIDFLTWLPPDPDDDSTGDESGDAVELSLQSEHDSQSELDAVFTAWDGPIVSDGLL